MIQNDKRRGFYGFSAPLHEEFGVLEHGVAYIQVEHSS